MNPLSQLHPKARLGLYLAYACLGPILLWTKAHGWTGQAEVDLWVGLGTALGLTAASNTSVAPPEPEAAQDPLPVDTGDMQLS